MTQPTSSHSPLILPGGVPAAERFPGLSRRTFLSGAVALGGATLMGCARNDSLKSGDVDLGDSRDLGILTWPDYIDPDDNEASTLSTYSATFRRPDYIEDWSDNVTGWDLVRPALEAGRQPVVADTAIDIMVPTNWLAARMVQLGHLAELPIEAIPNHKNIDPLFLTMSWDRGARFHMPWQSGITGIAYQPEIVTNLPLDADGGFVLADVFDPDAPWAGRLGMIGEMREAVGLAMLAQGNDPSQPTKETAQQGLQFLIDRKANLQKWYFDDFTEALEDRGPDGVDITMAWSGNTLLMETPVEFVVPVEGAIQWFDTMVIPNGSPNLGAAADWMNFVYEPEVAAGITAYLGYVSPVLGVKDILDPLAEDDDDIAAYVGSELVFPTDETRRRLFTWGTLDVEAELELEGQFDAAFADFFPE